MTTAGSTGVAGIPPFHVHPGHRFEGFELVEPPNTPPQVVARCECGAILDRADASLADCPQCAGGGGACLRCGGTGRVVDHAALQWRVAEP